MEPKQLTSDEDRRMARYVRDRHWQTLERAAEHNPLYICWWDKDRRHSRSKEPLPDDLQVHGLIGGMEVARWLRDHPDWTEIGEWSDERYAVPVWITDAGREALQNRHLYDMEPVYGGMVEPGWQAIPAEKEAEPQTPGG